MADRAELVLLRATRDQVDEAVRWVEQAAARVGLDLRRAADLGADVARAMIDRIDRQRHGPGEDLHLVFAADTDQVAVTVAGSDEGTALTVCRSRTTGRSSKSPGESLRVSVGISPTRAFSQHKVPSRR